MRPQLDVEVTRDGAGEVGVHGKGGSEEAADARAADRAAGTAKPDLTR